MYRDGDMHGFGVMMVMGMKWKMDAETTSCGFTGFGLQLKSPTFNDVLSYSLSVIGIDSVSVLYLVCE